MPRRAITLTFALALLTAGCAQPGSPGGLAPSVPPVPPSAVPPAPTPTEQVIEDPPCPPAGLAAELGRVRRVDGAPRCMQEWAVATARTEAGPVRVVLRRQGFEYVVVDVSRLAQPCSAALAALPAGLRGAAGCRR